MVKNSLQKKELSFSTFMSLPAVKKKVYDIVAGKNGDRFITSIVTAVGANPTLAECDYSSILSAALLGESLKLSPSPQLGQYYLVPYKDNKRGITVAQFQLGYKGYKQLAQRSGQIVQMDAFEVKQGELEHYNYFEGDIRLNYIEDETVRSELPTIGYYGFYKLINGYKQVLYWSKEKMVNHAKTYSQGYADDLKRGTKYTFWSKNFDEMAKKTIMRQLISKGAPLAIDYQQGYISDMGVINEDGTADYIDSNLDDREIFKDVSGEDYEVTAESYDDAVSSDETSKQAKEGGRVQPCSKKPSVPDLPFPAEPEELQGQQSLEDAFFG